MSDAAKKNRVLRSQRSIRTVHYNLKRQEVDAKPLEMPDAGPPEVHAYDRQVAGHTAVKDNKYLGLLQCKNGRILKPIIKEAQRREMEFYERLATATHPDLVELRQLVPRYFGCQEYTYNGHTQEYIILEDLTQLMTEPCIMDVKIGRRTWDPLATEEKIKREQEKYAQCKQEFGFCIPGFQVYDLKTGQLHKYNKEYGKKLHGDMVVEAIKKYLNREGRWCRSLLLQQLAALWRLHAWARRQRAVTLCSASLLLVYDAAELRGCCAHRSSKCQPPQRTRRRSMDSLHSITDSGSNFSGQISNEGPVYKKVNPVPLTSMSLAQTSFSPLPPISTPWNEVLEKVDQSHSFDNNYEDKLCKMKIDFKTVLDQMSSELNGQKRPWATVKLIDFAHAFFNDDNEIGPDENFIEGIDNFVKIYESFLSD